MGTKNRRGSTESENKRKQSLKNIPEWIKRSREERMKYGTLTIIFNLAWFLSQNPNKEFTTAYLCKKFNLGTKQLSRYIDIISEKCPISVDIKRKEILDFKHGYYGNHYSYIK